MPDAINFAILGAGISGDFHQKAIEASSDLGARLVAVGHYDPAKYDEIGSRFGVACVSRDELLADSAVDVVCICTPSGQHAGQVIAAVEAGKHVLVEKPMALSLVSVLILSPRLELVMRPSFGISSSLCVRIALLRPMVLRDDAVWRRCWKSTEPLGWPDGKIN